MIIQNISDRGLVDRGPIIVFGFKSGILRTPLKNSTILVEKRNFNFLDSTTFHIYRKYSGEIAVRISVFFSQSFMKLLFI